MSNCRLPNFCRSVTVPCLLAAFLFAGPVHAEERHGHAHEHGVSKLKLAIDGNALEMELVSPGSDIVGFEHPPGDAADRQAIEKAVAVFRDASAMFVLPASAACKLASVKIEAPDHDDDKHDHDKHHDEKHHGEKQGHHKHDHDKHDHAKGAKETEHHSEFEGHYRYTCGNPQKLTHIDIKMFDRFPRAREIEAEAITPSGQIARELTPKTARLQL